MVAGTIAYSPAMPINDSRPNDYQPKLLALAVVGAIIAAVAACSTSTNTSSTTASPTSPTASPTSPTASPTSTTATATGTAGAPFVGHWHVHGSAMDIAPDKATLITYSCPGSGTPRDCHETDTLSVVSGDGKQLTLQVATVSFTNNAGAAVPIASQYASTAVGDELQLVAQAPGLLKATILHGFPGWVGGNPYWCGAGIGTTDRTKCGA